MNDEGGAVSVKTSQGGHATAMGAELWFCHQSGPRSKRSLVPAIRDPLYRADRLDRSRRVDGSLWITLDFGLDRLGSLDR